MAKKVTKKRATPLANRPLVPGSPTTYGQAAQERDAALTVKYAPAEAALGQRQQNAGSWFDQYKRDVAQSAQAQQQRYAAAIQGINAQSAASAQQGAAQQQALQAQMQADAANRGATYSGVPTQQGQAGVGVRYGNADSFAALLGAQGVTYAGQKAGQIGVGSAAQLSERLRAQKDRATLATQKGADATDYMAKARDAEQKSVLENALFGLKTQTQADTVASNKARLKSAGKIAAGHDATSVANTRTRTAAAKAKADQQAAQKDAIRVGKVRDTSQAGLGRLDAINGYWQHFRTQKITEVDAKGKDKLDANGQPIKRPPRPHEVTDRILSTTKGPDGKPFTPQELHLARLIRDHVLFSPADVALAHRLKIRVPRNLIQSGYATGGPGPQRPT